jgi:hypothetical protein
MKTTTRKPQRASASPSGATRIAGKSGEHPATSLDQRPATDALRGLQALADASARGRQSAAMRATVHAGPRMIAQRKGIENAFGDAVQRLSLEEEEPLQGKLLQRMAPEEEELLQGKFAQRMSLEEEEPLQGKFASPPVQLKPEAKENRTGMPDHLKAGMENLAGMDMSDVRVSYNSPKPAALNAHAYAQGTDIHLAPGQERHLPHEAWHVVQQKQGRVHATMQMAGTPVSDDAGLEHEADVMGAKAARRSR